jgi:hypothetical protein
MFSFVSTFEFTSIGKIWKLSDSEVSACLAGSLKDILREASGVSPENAGVNLVIVSTLLNTLRTFVGSQVFS